MTVVHGRRQGNHRRTPLVIVENRDVQHGVKGVLNFKTGRGRDIFQIDTAIHRGDRQDRINHPLGVGFAGVFAIHAAMIHRDRPAIYVAKRLEENGLSLHDGNARFGPEVAESQNGRAIRDHRHQVFLCRATVEGFAIAGNFLHGEGHSGGVGEGEVIRSRQGLGDPHTDFAADMILKDLFVFQAHNAPH
jgi:hypothetical protein